MKTSLGIWAFGAMATRFNPGGYKPELAGASTVSKVRTAVEGLGDLMGQCFQGRASNVQSFDFPIKYTWHRCFGGISGKPP